jgi:Aminoglycoside-2''-adenylyltransferase
MSDTFAPARDTVRLLSAFPHSWVFAGGWAIDLFVGRVTRPHKDIDVAIFREHQLELQRSMMGWRMYVANSGTLVPWQSGEYVELPLHTVWAYRPGKTGAGSIEVQPDLEFLFNEREAENWVFRRNPLMTRPLDLACVRASNGLPYLAPEIVLLYKSKGTRDSDQADFQAVLGLLSREQRAWLKGALEVDGPGHEWLKRL